MANEMCCANSQTDNMRRERLSWFNEARFGMLIHWGLYSVLGRGEWAQFKESIPSTEYSKLADCFEPKHFNADEWTRLAKEAGMRYMVLTTKHHEGFCLFNSQYSDFTAMKSKANRDYVAEYVQACRKAGLGVGLYITMMDWSDPATFAGPAEDPEGWDRLVQRLHDQVWELMTNYGKIDILWYDGCGDGSLTGRHGNGRSDAENWRTVELNEMVRKLQPDILINNRAGTLEDFGTPEQTILSTSNLFRMNESCLTMNDSWGYCAKDKRWKSTAELLDTLIRCASLGNNLLLNVGPDADGLIPYESVNRLRDMGNWLTTHGEAVYGTEHILSDWWDCMSPGGRITTKGNNAYVLMNEWDTRDDINITSLKNQVRSASLLATGEKLSVNRQGCRIKIGNLPHYPPSALLNVVKLELDGPAETQFYG
jgi:alpha-L-fucosidase